MTDREKLIDLFQDSKSPAWVWFPNNAAMLKFVDYLLTGGVTVQKWLPVTEPPKETGHYLVNIHQEDQESGEMCDFVLDAWYQVNGLLFAPKEIGCCVVSAENRRTAMPTCWEATP